MGDGKIITLTTDFGASDWYVGAVKGVILSVHPQANIVDIAHDVPAGDVRAGAFVLAGAYPYFPRSSVHLVVVDPGVGSPRAALAVKTRDYYFVGPDNGVLALALSRQKIEAIHRLENPKFFRQPLSQTFHGRDIFAPASAYLSMGRPLAAFGAPVRDLVRPQWPAARRTRHHIRGEVVYIDHFGNAVTNIPGEWLPKSKTATRVVRLGGRRDCPVAAFYQAAAPGRPLALVGSSGWLELSVNSGSAARVLGLGVGTPVELSSLTH